MGGGARAHVPGVQITRFEDRGAMKLSANPDVAHIRFQTYRLLESRFQPDKGRLVRFELFNIAAVGDYFITNAFLYSSCGFYRGSIFHVFTNTCIENPSVYSVFFRH